MSIRINYRNSFLSCILVLMLLPLTQASLAQGQIEDIVKQAERLEISKYDFQNKEADYFLIEMSFERFDVRNLEALDTLQAKQILAVDLVYTLFPKGQDFENLNKNRLKALEKAFPTITQKENIRWRYVGQDACQTRLDAQKLFHGFVVYYKNFESLQEISMPLTTQRAKQIFQKKLNYRDSLTLAAIMALDFIPKDSLVFEILNRKKGKWQKNLVVIDWTGSMYAYGMQVLVWLKQNTQQHKNFRHFVFFNDGDNKSLGEKVIGQTGGIYASPSGAFSDIIQTMLQTQQGGIGGYDSENDIEALLKGQAWCKKCENIILIADNNSFIRDLSLLNDFANRCHYYKQKLHIILCGLEKSNQLLWDYLHLAYQAKGTLHTINEDLENFEDLEKGGTITFQGLTFEIGKYGVLEIVKKKKKKKRMK